MPDRSPNAFWTWVRRLAFFLALGVAILYPIMYLHLLSQGQSRPDLLLDAALGALAAWFLARAARTTTPAHNACPACAGVLRRTRNPEGVRFWTCSACGYERPRLRSRREVKRQQPRNPTIP